MFITFEGVEGSGKTSQIGSVAGYLKKRGLPFRLTREPGGTVIGKSIRAILLNPEHRALDPVAELLMYAADRVQHVKEVIAPALADGMIVLCDRYFDATLAYQGYARGIDMDVIISIHQMVLDGLMPDLTFLFDLPVEIGLSRAWGQVKNGARTGGETRFEKEKLDFHRKVRSGYLELAKKEPKRIRIINAERNEEEVLSSILAILSDVLTGLLPANPTF
ncbi:MAG: dTMP kinase [Pseudomonadota bacterium]